MSETADHELYSGYEEWKGWDNPFTYSDYDSDYFDGETKGLKIAGADLLEIGFGSGNFLAWAKDKGATVSGTEINEKLLDNARERNVSIIDADFEKVADKMGESFDTIIAFDVFEHFELPDVITRLRASEKLLRPGGHLLMRFPNSQSPFGLAPQNGDPTHKSHLSKSVFEQLMQGTEFKITRYAGSYRVLKGSITQRIVRTTRSAVKGIIQILVDAIYVQKVPLDPVVTIVMRKK